MLYYTQLIYIKEGKEEAFQSFEDHVLPMLEKYNGRLLIRLRPEKESVIETKIDYPYEVHVVSFASKEDFVSYANDKDRLEFLPLKNESVLKVLLIEGVQI